MFSQFFPVHQGRGAGSGRAMFDRAVADAYIGETSGTRSVSDMAESTTEIEDRQIVVTENAARRIAALRTQEEADGAFLRIAVSGGGCSGFQYGFKIGRASCRERV